MNKENQNNVNTAKDTKLGYSFYSRLLGKPFDTVEELAAAEAAYYDKLRAKDEKAAAKKADAQKVEDAFKALNAARRDYKDKLNQLTDEFSEALADLKKAYELGKTNLHNQLAAAEQAYKDAIKTFGDKYPEGYHMTLKDGDFETTISCQTSKDNINYKNMSDLFSMMFNL
jgi:hypothetical protein